jgi:hypothetical protein
VIALGLVGLASTAGNAWWTAERSTIPIAVDGRVASVERLREKHEGVDDVRIVRFEDRAELEVDEPVFREVRAGSVLEKHAGERTLRVDGRGVALDWSADARGMVVAMPIALLLLGVVLVYGARVPIRRP